MALACQQNSYLKTLTTGVRSCTPSKLKRSKKEVIDGFDVILEDSVLFPEGGGQPDDRGTINGIEVLRVVRNGVDAVHFLRESLDPGSQVEVVVDWDRRFDHMQQHTAQHLITAITEGKYAYKTTSWRLGERVCYIELDTPSMTPAQRSEVEGAVNQAIRDAVTVKLSIYQDKYDPDLQNFRGLGLPDDHIGSVRVITIEGVDSALCCGTHVTNLSHLQAIKLLSVEKGKQGKINLYFVCGERLLAYVSQSYDVDRGLSTILSGPQDKHVDLADKMLKSYKQSQKMTRNYLIEIAKLEVAKFKATYIPGDRRLFSLHRTDGNNEFMNIVTNEMDNENITCFLTVVDSDKGDGLFLLSGTEQMLSELAPRVLEILEAKGVNKRGRLQGKVGNLAKIGQVEELLQDHIDRGHVVPA